MSSALNDVLFKITSFAESPLREIYSDVYVNIYQSVTLELSKHYAARKFL